MLLLLMLLVSIGFGTSGLVLFLLVRLDLLNLLDLLDFLLFRLLVLMTSISAYAIGFGPLSG